MGLAARGRVLPLSGPSSTTSCRACCFTGCGGASCSLAAQHQVPAHGGDDAEDQDPKEQQETEPQRGDGEVAHAWPPWLAGSRRKMIFVRPIVMVEPSVSSVLPET